jgi:hypothetical protein
MVGLDMVTEEYHWDEIEAGVTKRVRMEEKNVYLQRFQMTTGIEELP